MHNEVIEFDKGRRIAWQPTSFKGLVGGRIWRYELSPAKGGGTLVRETWDVSRGGWGHLPLAGEGRC
jgi:hypothetical protein